MEKKGQVTVFIIVGIVLIVAIAAYLIISNLVIEEPEIESPETQPVKDYIETCIQQITLEGLDIMAKQGGYIEIPDPIYYNSRAYLRNDLFGNIEYPFWFYDGINNMPSLDTANNELTNYILDSFYLCQNFTHFRQYNVTPLRNTPGIEVIFAGEDTIVKADYPLIITDISTGEVNRDTEVYQVSVPVRFRTVFEAAEQILKSELEQKFLEKKVIDLIAMTPEDEIPYTGVEFSCQRKTWYLPDIETRLKELINVNFPYIKFANLPYNEDKYIPVPDQPNKFKNSYYNLHYIFDAGILPDNNLRATIFYDSEFPFSIHANPSDKKRMISNAQKAQGIASLFCLNIWHFTYDIDFPVIVRVKDLPTDNRPPYVFEFGTKVMINHNQPDHKTLASTLYEPRQTADTEEYCETDYNDNEITVMAMNKDTHLEIADVNISFVCGFMECPLGKTDYVANLGNRPALRARVPQCVNAVLKASKPGYKDAKHFGDVNTEMPSTYFIEMTKVKEIPEVEVVKHMMTDSDVSPQETPLADDEIAAIMITTESDPDYQIFYTYPQMNFEDEPVDPFPIELFEDADITYQVTIYVNRLAGTQQAMTAAYEAEWKPSSEDIADARKLKFHTVSHISTDDYETFLFMQGIPSYSKQVKLPELIS